MGFADTEKQLTIAEVEKVEANGPGNYLGCLATLQQLITCIATGHHLNYPSNH